MDNPATVSIVGTNSQIVGKLDINIIPVDTDGESEVPDEYLPETPEDLINNRIDFIVEIKKAYELPEDFCKDIFCEYTFYINEEKFTTPPVPGQNRSPEFNFRQLHTIEPCTDYFV